MLRVGKDKGGVSAFQAVHAAALAPDMLKAKVRGSGDMDGLTTWVPDRHFDDGEMEIKHTLGRMPSGFISLCGTLPLQWYATIEQRSRWTAEKVFIYPVKNPVWGTLEGNITSALPNTYVDIMFAKPLPYPQDECHMMWGVSCDQGTLNRDFSIATSFLDSAGSVSTTPLFYGARLTCLSGSPVVGAEPFKIRCDLTVHPGTEDEFILQFF